MGPSEHSATLGAAAFTLAGRKGTNRNRTPIASKTAFEIADGTTIGAISPAPHSGTPGKRKIG
ncbi:MAG: hypothetical protein QMB14_04845 [Polaromonas sp.]|jgi:acid phosphatase family membrane protein YuiD